MTLRKGHGDELISELSREKAFILWAGSLWILYKLKDSLGDVSRGLWLLLMLSLLIKLIPKLLEVEQKIIEKYTLDNIQQQTTP